VWRWMRHYVQTMEMVGMISGMQQGTTTNVGTTTQMEMGMRATTTVGTTTQMDMDQVSTTAQMDMGMQVGQTTQVRVTTQMDMSTTTQLDMDQVGTTMQARTGTTRQDCTCPLVPTTTHTPALPTIPSQAGTCEQPRGAGRSTTTT
jgi:hypothetical protein